MKLTNRVFHYTFFMFLMKIHRWQDQCLEVRSASQTLLLAELSRMGSKGRKALVDSWAPYLPFKPDKPAQPQQPHQAAQQPVAQQQEGAGEVENQQHHEEGEEDDDEHLDGNIILSQINQTKFYFGH